MRATLFLPLALVALTLLVYAPVRGFEFVNYDDNVYVTENSRVSHGLSWANFVWSLSAFENGNWHPLTLLSHMLDVELFGLKPAGHHLVNLALHVVNVLLLFLLLAWTTSRPWPSAFAAALFAVHPLNVETVAWIAERKSLLSTTFWLLALLARVRYRVKPDAKRYSLVLLLAALALAAKPMAVTLPLTVLLLDVWPLETEPPGRGPLALRYLRDLGPLLALSLLCGVLTLRAQQAVHALQTVESYPLPVRLANAVVAYVWYLAKTVWPVGLAAFYPHPLTTLAAAEVAASGLCLVAVSAAMLWKGRDLRFLATGWWWYAGTLLPVAGIVQVGSQAYADRYAYVPLIGIFVLTAWSLAKGMEEWRPVLRTVLAVVPLACIGSLSIATREQLTFWHDSVSLFRRALALVPDNAVAHNNLGMALVARNRTGDALDHFRAAVEIAPWDTDARSNLGNALRALRRPADAVAAYEKALELRPDDPSIHYNLATALLDLGRTDEAISHLREAARLDPAYARAKSLLGTLLGRERP